MSFLKALATEWYWLLVLGLLVVGLILAHFSNRLREGQPRLASIFFGAGLTLLSLWLFLVSGLAGFIGIVLIDFIETYPRLGFLSRLVLYYLVVLPLAGAVAHGLTWLIPGRPKWFTYVSFALGVLGGTYFVFFFWQPLW